MSKLTLYFLALITAFCLPLRAQVPQNVSARGINLPYYEGSEIKAHFTAATADPVPGGKISAGDFKMVTFGKGGTNNIELIVKSPKCFFDSATKQVWSSGSLEVYSVNSSSSTRTLPV